MKPILPLVLLSSLAFAQFTPETMMKPEAFTNDTGIVYNYRVWAPQFPQAGKKYPVILFLHGSGECGTDNNKQITVAVPALLKSLMQQKEQPIVIAPQCQTGALGRWVRRIAFTENYSADKNPAPALETALAIAQHVIATKQGDENRFYITGLSLGGFGTWDAISRDPSPFAAAAPLSAGGDIRLAKNIGKLPIWVAHGTADKNVPVDCSRRMVRACRDAGNRNVVYKEHENAPHDVWSRTYSDPEFIDWLLSQNRRKPWWKFW